MITIDGSSGEGGGQIVRSSLALSILTGRAFRITNIRARRDKPGLQRQHRTAVNAAAAISGAKVTGNDVGSRELSFEPCHLTAGDYTFDIGSAGSTTLVLQTILPPLLTAASASTIRLRGGTHNPNAPPVDFLERAYLPLVNRMGPQVSVTLERPGFYPAGGGQLVVQVRPSKSLAPFDLVERGAIRTQLCQAVVARLPASIAQRELNVVAETLGWSSDMLRLEELPYGPGNYVTIEIESQHVTELFSSIGRRGVRAEAVAADAAEQAADYLRAGVPVGIWLADQLLLPMALAGGGSFVTLAPSQHAHTNMRTIETFLDVQFAVERLDELRWQIGVQPAR